MTAFEFLKWMRDEKRVPWSREANRDKPSNSELLRWIKNGSVKVDGEKLTLQSMVFFPVERVEFFHGKALVTMPGFGE